MLCGAAVVSCLLAFIVERTVTAYIEGIAIIVTILVVTNVAAFMDWQKGQRFFALNNKVSDIQVEVARMLFGWNGLNFE